MEQENAEAVDSGRNYFKVDPDRHNKNKLEKLSRLNINPYTGHPILVERHVRRVSTKFEPPKRRSEVWTLEQIRTFLEKFFVYPRRNFMRIAEFFPFKDHKDVTSLYYALKKHLNLSQKEKEVRDCIGNKLHFIHRLVEEVYTAFFKGLEKLSTSSSQDSDSFTGYHQSFTLQQIMDHIGKLNPARASAPVYVEKPSN